MAKSGADLIMKTISRSTTVLVLLALGACTTVPTGPSVMALPGSTKSFDEFRADDRYCRQYALEQIGGATASQNATNSAVTSAAVGTLVGAAAGAALGGHNGAGVGAGTGLLVGTMAGTGTANASTYGTQRRYDNAYVQCMYAKGERVPVSGQLQSVPARTSGTPPAPPRNVIPPPPPGSPPPPPPGYVPG